MLVEWFKPQLPMKSSNHSKNFGKVELFLNFLWYYLPALILNVSIYKIGMIRVFLGQLNKIMHVKYLLCVWCVTNAKYSHKWGFPFPVT